MLNYIIRITILLITATTCSSCIQLGNIHIEQSDTSGYHRKYSIDPQTRLYYCENDTCNMIIEYENKGAFFVKDASHFLSFYLIYNRNSKSTKLIYINSQFRPESGSGMSNNTEITQDNNKLIVNDYFSTTPTFYGSKFPQNFKFNFEKIQINPSTKDEIYEKIKNDEFILGILNSQLPEYINILK